jgi:hypothetical protein
MQEIGAKRNWLTERDSVLAISAQSNVLRSRPALRYWDALRRL